MGELEALTTTIFRRGGIASIQHSREGAEEWNNE